MASPAQGLTHREEAGVLRDFYLMLWKQLDVGSGQSNWFDIASVSGPDLQQRANELLSQIIELQADPALLSTARHDRERVAETMANLSNAEALEGFKSYLRDRALGFAQQAAHDR
jgi:hypothetical protein